MHHSWGSLAASVFLSVAAAAVVTAEPLPPAAMSKVTGEHFEIFTSGSPAHARNALVALEQAHSFFAAVEFVKADCATPLRIVAFHSTEEYATFRLHQNAFGHFFKGPTRSFIVLTDLLPEHREALLHEYTHFVVREAGLTLPQWLNEGIADLYSSLTVVDGHTLAGLPLPGRLRTIDSQGLVPTAEIFSSDSLAGDKSQAQLLYAESWALTHMLCFNPLYSANFGRFLRSASKKMDSAAVLEEIFGRSRAAIENDLQEYVGSLAAAQGVKIKLAIPTSKGSSQCLTEGEVDAVLTGLLEEQPWTRTYVHRQAE